MWSRRTDRPWTQVLDSCLLLGEHWPMDGTVRGRRWGWGPRWDGFRYESRSRFEDWVLPPVLNWEESKLVTAMQTKLSLGFVIEMSFPFSVPWVHCGSFVACLLRVAFQNTTPPHPLPWCLRGPSLDCSPYDTPHFDCNETVKCRMWEKMTMQSKKNKPQHSMLTFASYACGCMVRQSFQLPYLPAQLWAPEEVIHRCSSSAGLIAFLILFLIWILRVKALASPLHLNILKYFQKS